MIMVNTIILFRCWTWLGSSSGIDLQSRATTASSSSPSSSSSPLPSAILRWESESNLDSKHLKGRSRGGGPMKKLMMLRKMTRRIILYTRWWPWWRGTSPSTPQSSHAAPLSSGTLTDYINVIWSHLQRWGIAYRVVLNGLGIYTTWTVIARCHDQTSTLTLVITDHWWLMRMLSCDDIEDITLIPSPAFFQLVKLVTLTLVPFSPAWSTSPLL